MTHQHAVDSAATERFFLREMSPVEAVEFLRHAAECEECRSGVTYAGYFIAGVKDVLAEGPKKPFGQLKISEQFIRLSGWRNRMPVKLWIVMVKKQNAAGQWVNAERTFGKEKCLVPDEEIVLVIQ